MAGRTAEDAEDPEARKGMHDRVNCTRSFNVGDKQSLCDSSVSTASFAVRPALG
jgi:hypothetical protein